jgi:hypothetical protein
MSMKTRKRIPLVKFYKKNMFFEFFVANICHFEKIILQKDILSQIPCLQGKIQW